MEVVTQDIDSGKTVSGVRLSNGDSLPADVVLIAVGVVPNTGFLAGSGINVDAGIVVDNYLQTNLPGIYAAGDVAQGFDRCTGANKINIVLQIPVSELKLCLSRRTGFLISTLSLCLCTLCGMYSLCFWQE